jgi:uncharacterized membrane protein YeaQ/YmgE (transglycosylase-associated protein family)
MEQFLETVSLLFSDLLMWIGFGTLVGLLAKAVMPGKDPGGTLATVFIGILGCFFGAATWFYITGSRVVPISLTGLLAGMGGASVLLFTYRALNGNPFKKNGGLRRPRRRVSVVEDD